MVVNSITSRVHCQAVFLIAHTQVGRRVWTIVENSIVNLDVMQMRLMNGLCPAVADRKFGVVINISGRLLGSIEAMSGTSIAYATPKHAPRG